MRTGTALDPSLVPNIRGNGGQRTMRGLMTPIPTIVGVALLSSALCFANDFDDLPEVKALQKGMPKEIASFISRAAECHHWGGEDPYDKERAEFIGKAVETAGCSKLDGDAKHLRQKYQRDPKVLETIEKAKDLFM